MNHWRGLTFCAQVVRKVCSSSNIDGAGALVSQSRTTVRMVLSHDAAQTAREQTLTTQMSCVAVVIEVGNLGPI